MGPRGFSARTGRDDRSAVFSEITFVLRMASSSEVWGELRSSLGELPPPPASRREDTLEPLQRLARLPGNRDAGHGCPSCSKRSDRITSRAARPRLPAWAHGTGARAG